MRAGSPPRSEGPPGRRGLPDSVTMRSTSDYDTVTATLRWFLEHQRSRPPLDEVARQVGLCTERLHGVFLRWAGVKPERFLQFLMLEHTRARLRHSEPLLERAFSAPPSDMAPAHGLTVIVEEVTPGGHMALGVDLTLLWGIHPSPFGPVLLAAGNRGLAHLAFLPAERAAQPPIALQDLEAAWPRAQMVEATQETGAIARSIFFPGDRGASPPPLALFLRGTPFQLKVWKTLLRIPPGALTTYGRLAEALGHPRAARAVGTAVAANPIAFLIPCHRVIGGQGAAGGYRWEPLRKQAILGWEAARWNVEESALSELP